MPADDAPLKLNWFYILLSLAAGERHGLGIARDVLELSEGRVRLWPATLYGSLEDLCDRRWIKELDELAAPPDESERRRYYRITRSGRTVVAAETERLTRLARVARARLHARTGAAG
jgi:DNA-binding PadR family transcriptional regulator